MLLNKSLNQFTGSTSPLPVIALYFLIFCIVCCSLFGAMFPLPRIIYAMAMDGLIFRFLGQVNHYFRTPLYGTLIAGLLTGLS